MKCNQCLPITHLHAQKYRFVAALLDKVQCRREKAIRFGRHRARGAHPKRQQHDGESGQQHHLIDCTKIVRLINSKIDSSVCLSHYVRRQLLLYPDAHAQRDAT